MFDHEFSYISTRCRCHCQEFNKKHYIVVIKTVGAWHAGGGDSMIIICRAFFSFCRDKPLITFKFLCTLLILLDMINFENILKILRHVSCSEFGVNWSWRSFWI